MNFFTEFALVIGLAAMLGILATKLKQPAILGYIICGLLVAVFAPNFNEHKEQLDLLSKVGIVFLLFLLGLELNPSELKKLGRVAFITGVGQIVFTFVIGLSITLILGFDLIPAMYISIGLTLSSTIIVVKILSQKKELETLHGRISISFLLIQDMVAILLMTGLSATGKNIGGIDAIAELGFTLIKGSLAVGAVILFMKFIFNYILDWIKNDREILFITVIAWVLGVAAFVSSVGLSIEIGALLAGIVLAQRYESLQIESWTRPLRDFFITIFFVILGLELNLTSVASQIEPALILSAFVLIGNPIIVMVLLGSLGYSSKVSFLTSLVVAQVSEFSLILVRFGTELNQINSEILTLITLVAGITMVISSYTILYSENLYELFKNQLKIFEFRHKELISEQLMMKFDHEYETILLGCHRMGRRFLAENTHKKADILVIDYDPDVVKELISEGYEAVYADLSDGGVYESLPWSTAKTVVSTIPHIKDNNRILHFVSTLSSRPVVIVTANDDAHARELYAAGADFVIYPHLLGGNLITDIIAEGFLSKKYLDMKNKHMNQLIFHKR